MHICIEVDKYTFILQMNVHYNSNKTKYDYKTIVEK